MIRVADYIAKKLESIGVKYLFMIAGGGAMHLNDAIGRSNIKYICNHHEQAAAISAEGYSRSNNELSVVMVTSGPGGTNTITGLIGNWLDSVPVLYISGQVKFETTIYSCLHIGLRQLGDQEINIIDIVKPVTKYASFVKEAKDIRYELEKAIYHAKNNRFGPVWLDIPLDVQGAMIDEDELKAYVPEPITLSNQNISKEINNTIELFNSAKRPVVIAGHGIHLANAREQLFQLIRKLGCPVVTTFNGFDLIPSDHPLFVGRIGTIGDRSGNFAIQNADLLLSVGSRNNIRQISYSWNLFSRYSKKIIVDIDESELKKHTLNADVTIHSDAKYFLDKMNGIVNFDNKKNEWSEWLEWCIVRKNKYPTVLPKYEKTEKGVHPYFFIRKLTEAINDDYTVVAGNGTACVVLYQAGIVKERQRMFWNSGCASMGYALPAAIGAFYATSKKIICITGDGSIMMNLQELQTIKHHDIPIKIFLLNNNGYCSIKQTQESFFDGRRVACDPESGVSFPDFESLSRGFKIDYIKIDNNKSVLKNIEYSLKDNKPLVCEVKLTEDYIFSPKLSSKKMPDGSIVSKPLEDMYPFMSTDELMQNLLIPPVVEN